MTTPPITDLSAWRTIVDACKSDHGTSINVGSDARRRAIIAMDSRRLKLLAELEGMKAERNRMSIPGRATNAAVDARAEIVGLATAEQVACWADGLELRQFDGRDVLHPQHGLAAYLARKPAETKEPCCLCGKPSNHACYCPGCKDALEIAGDDPSEGRPLCVECICNDGNEEVELLRDVANLDTGQDCDPAHHGLVVRAMDLIESNATHNGRRIRRTVDGIVGTGGQDAN